MESKLNNEQVDIIGHSLGINVYHARLSNDPKDKYLPDEFYRNYYCVGSVDNFTNEMIDLLDLGFIEKTNRFGQLYFHITEKGIDEFRKIFQSEISAKFIPLSKAKEKYREFLRTDVVDSFADYLMIYLPKREYNSIGMVRLVSTKYNDVKGQYCKTLKEAKLSYKESLNQKIKQKSKKYEYV